MFQPANELKTFEIKVDKDQCHFKTHCGNGTYYQSMFRIPDFSTFETAYATGFGLQDGFTHSITLSKYGREIQVLINGRGTNCRYNLKCCISVCTDSGKVLFHKTLDNYVWCCSVTDTEFVTCEEFLKLKDLPNDTLIVTWRIQRSFFDNISNHFSTMDSTIVAEYVKSLEADIKKFSIYSDENVHLRVGEETEVVSKALLCARSPVFEMMFRNDTKEATKNTVDITDVEMPVLKALISFLSTGVVPNCDFDFLCDLYYAADKYNVKELHHTCIRLLMSKMSLENVFRLLKLSIMHNDEFLKFLVMAVISTNIKTIKSTPDWENVIRDYPETAMKASKFCEF